MHPDTQKVMLDMMSKGLAANAEEAFDIGYQACKLVATCCKYGFSVSDTEWLMNDTKDLKGTAILLYAENLTETDIPLTAALGMTMASKALSDYCKKWKWDQKKVQLFLQEVSDTINWTVIDDEDL